MIKRYLAAALAVAALAVPAATAPAFANHTLCDNSDSSQNVWIGPANAGVDIGNAPGTVYFCAGYTLVVIRTSPGQKQTICTYYDWHNPSTANCIYL